MTEFQDRRERINDSVAEEVVTIFKGKTTNQLLLLEESIKKKLQGGEGVDIGKTTTNQLLLLEDSIKKKLQGGEGVDIGKTTTNQLLLLEESIKKKLQGGEGVNFAKTLQPIRFYFWEIKSNCRVGKM